MKGWMNERGGKRRKEEMKSEMQLSLVLFCMLLTLSTSGPKETRAGPAIYYSSIDIAYAKHFSRCGSRRLGEKGGGRRLLETRHLVVTT